ncbi:alpha-glucosidase [Marinomonas sp. IMCC 4694]|uniref:alpha-glucosidase n=1 Tax=Marinomonas sp. IMCC 4694 TaxID=2605432 RepID=UPI0011E8396B|nr:alpha-glucosidase [Marinomonas sp. IMCC 4694]TYL49241.1 DUF3459 domain-containing protein [Marinomonas sp. IMCC 4694]
MTNDNNWWKGAVIYQIYPRSYQDSNGDGIGDIPGISSRLPHIANLGVDAIWLSPIFTSPMKDMGYDVSDYCDIDPSFGTLADFDEMVSKAHALGMKVIIDQVISHSSNLHPFFQASRQDRTNPKADWYVWADPNPDGSAPNNWQAIFGGIAWTWEARRRQYFLHNFLTEQPDLNFHNPEVQQWQLDNMRFWLERGVDGFRLDTVNFYFHDEQLRNDPPNPKTDKQKGEWNPYHYLYHTYSKNQPENIAFLEKMRALLDEYDARTLVGEVGEAHRPIELMGEYTTGNRLHMAYSFEMLGHNFFPAHFKKQVQEFFAGAPDGWPNWAFSNHDVIRHVSRWLKPGMDPNHLAKQAAALLLSQQGSVCLYQGEEMGQLETILEYHELTDPQGLNFWPEDKGRDGCRTPMVWSKDQVQGGFSEGKPWLPVKPPQLDHAASEQVGVPGSVYEFYRQMLALRSAQPDLRLGDTRFIDAADPMLVYYRGENILCAFNLSAESHTLALPEGECVLSNQASRSGHDWQFDANGFVILRVK